MVKKYFPQIKIISAPTIRDKNGLAFSSRNSYLDHKLINIAPLFYKILLDGINNLKNSKNVEKTIKDIQLCLQFDARTSLQDISLNHPCQSHRFC